MKFPIARSDRLVRPWADALRWLFATPLVVVGLVLIAVGMLALVINWDRFSQSAAEIFSVGNWYWLIGFWVVLKIIHEMAHAIACHRQGGSVREMGVVLILFAPLAYVDVTSCWRMSSRWARIGVASAGMYVELVIAALAVLLWTQTESQTAAFLLHNLVITAGVSTLLFNANALMRFDGYFILADLIEIPNLAGSGAGAVRGLAKRVVLGERPAPSHFRGWRRGVHSWLWFGSIGLASRDLRDAGNRRINDVLGRGRADRGNGYGYVVRKTAARSGAFRTKPVPHRPDEVCSRRDRVAGLYHGNHSSGVLASATNRGEGTRRRAVSAGDAGAQPSRWLRQQDSRHGITARSQG